jgi:CHAT domain-containing protein
VRFPPLASARLEIEGIARAWGAATSTASSDRRDVVTLMGREASEASFERLAPGRRVLHLATHGFFIDPKCVGENPRTRGVTGLAPAAAPHSDPVDIEASATGMLLRLSGLSLAGANHRNESRPDEDDGILTAEEIAQLDLSGVEWAVLSACETGVGETTAGEGVLGLRRAFQIAGARCVVLSLWVVEDEAARQWMTSLYRHRLEQGARTDEAVRGATLEMLNARRRQRLDTHPFHWGAFIAAGDWR